MNNASYTKEQKLAFPVKGLRLCKIPVLESAPLSFYQKYIVLLLQKGIFADSVNELCEKISNIINISINCVTEFIFFLKERSFIVFEESTSRFSLSDTLNVSIKPEFGNSMFAETDVKMADCDKVIYVEGLNELYLESDFATFSRKGDAINVQNRYLGTELLNSICSRPEKIEELVGRHFADTNVHLKEPFSFDIKGDNYYEYQIEFPALMQYRYSAETKESIREKTIVPNNNFLPDSFVEELSRVFDKDNDLPRFIKFDESFYQKINPSTSELKKLEDEIKEMGLGVAPLKEDLKGQKAVLEKEKKDFKKQKKVKTEELDDINQDLQNVSDAIDVYESVVQSTESDENEELIRNLKKTIEENMREKERLSIAVQAKEAEIASIEKSFKAREDSLASEIDKKAAEIAELDSKTKKYEKDFAKLTKDYGKLLSDNKKYLNDTVKKVLDKYPSDENIFYRDITDIVVQIDGALSASESSSFDEMRRSLADVRNRYRNAVKITFDVLLGKNLQNLGSYYTNPYDQIALENMFRIKKINLDVKNKMIMFHSLINAIGHLADNDPKKFENKKRIEDFKNMSVNEREKILVSVPTFFAEVNFSKAEIRGMIEKLKV